MSRSTSPQPRTTGTPASSTVVLPARSRTTAPRGASGGRRRLAATVARWPLEIELGLGEGNAYAADAAVAIVRACLTDYRSGRADRASRLWHDDITWTVPGPEPVGGTWVGPEGVFAYHALVQHLSRGTFVQRLVALEGSRGAIVDAYLRTSVTRRGRRLDMPTLLVFELVAGRVRRVTEMPGDHEAWTSIWSD